MLICLVRHGQTNWNKRTLIQGLTDNPLNEVGISQAKKVAQYLQENDPDWDIFISSPLIRAVETAKVVKEGLNFKGEITIEQSLIERNFGELEGLTLDSSTYDIIDKEETQGLESKLELETRSMNALIDLEKKYKGKKVIAFSHAQFIKSIITQLDEKFNFRSLLKNSSMNYFEVKDGIVRIVKYNISAE